MTLSCCPFSSCACARPCSVSSSDSGGCNRGTSMQSTRRARQAQRRCRPRRRRAVAAKRALARQSAGPPPASSAPRCSCCSSCTIARCVRRSSLSSFFATSRRRSQLGFFGATLTSRSACARAAASPPARAQQAAQLRWRGTDTQACPRLRRPRRARGGGPAHVSVQRRQHFRVGLGLLEHGRLRGLDRAVRDVLLVVHVVVAEAQLRLLDGRRRRRRGRLCLLARLGGRGAQRAQPVAPRVRLGHAAARRPGPPGE